MSWAEVNKINNNMTKTLNEQARELTYSGAYLFTNNATFTPTQNGWYKIIVVGSGGKAGISSSHEVNSSGSSGGVAIKTKQLISGQNYSIVISSTQSSFNNEIFGTNAKDSRWANQYYAGDVGTASGGDFNYNGLKGIDGTNSAENKVGADVGVYIPALMQKNEDLTTKSLSSVTITLRATSGYGILGYGCGQGSYLDEDYSGKAVSPHKSGCVLIIPLELK